MMSYFVRYEIRGLKEIEPIRKYMEELIPDRYRGMNRGRLERGSFGAELYTTTGLTKEEKKKTEEEFNITLTKIS